MRIGILIGIQHIYSLQLEKGIRLAISYTQAKRREIQDRNGQPLAMNGIVYEVGIVPSEFRRKEGCCHLTDMLLY